MQHETLVIVLEITGVLLALLGLIVAVLVYFFDIRTKLESILKWQADAFKYFQYDLRQGLEVLVRDQEGVLSQFQANHLLDLYLDEITSHLSLALSHYESNDLPGHFEAKQPDVILHELMRGYRSVVRKSVRPMVSPFRLRTDQMFDDVVASASEDGLKQAFVSIQAALVTRFLPANAQHEFIIFVKHTLLEASDHGRQVIRERIDDLYSHSPVRWKNPSVPDPN